MSIVSANDLKTWVGAEDAVDDSTLAYAVDAASLLVREHCGGMRIFDKTATDDASARVYRPDDQCILKVHDFWTTTALEVAVDFGDNHTYSTTWTLNSDFIVEPPNAVADSEPFTQLRVITSYFPTYNNFPSVQVTAAWGWPSYPGPVKQAALIKASRIWKRKDSPEGIVGGFADFTAVRISTREDPDVLALLQPYRRNESAAPVR